MSDFAIRTDRLTRDFKTVRAVDGLTLEVPSGIVFGFLGPNGAGKTTTIHLLLGLLDPTSGYSEVLGFDSRTMGDRVRERTGALLEFNGLYERLSAEENLDFSGRVYKIPAPERHARTRELLTRFELWDRRKERTGTWSRGMKQKLAVARAIYHRPSLLFLDEPTAGLDPMAAATLRDDLAHLASGEGITVFLTTHNLPEAEKLCSRVGVISRGKLAAVGHPDDLRARSGGQRVEIHGGGFTPDLLDRLRLRGDVASAETVGDRLQVTLAPNCSAAPMVRFLVQTGADIEEVRKGTASLEEAFPHDHGGGEMISDMLTVMRKEGIELLHMRGSARGTFMITVFPILILGVIFPLQFGRAWAESPVSLIAWGMDTVALHHHHHRRFHRRRAGASYSRNPPRQPSPRPGDPFRETLLRHAIWHLHHRAHHLHRVDHGEYRPFR